MPWQGSPWVIGKGVFSLFEFLAVLASYSIKMMCSTSQK